MGANTWGLLPKSLSDPQKIAEFVAAQFAAHNADDSAHGQSEEAIYNHRIAEILDHLDESITNAKIIASHRTYNAVVGPDDEDDFDNIQDAIDFVNGIGGGTIFIKAGTYTQSADLVLYSNITLESNDPNAVIIDFNALSKYLKIIGTAPAHIENVTLKNLTITSTAAGSSGSTIIDYADDITIENCTFSGQYLLPGGGSGDIGATNVTRLRITGCYFVDSRYCILPAFFTDLFIENNYVESVAYAFLELQDTGTRLFCNNNFIEQCGEFFRSEYGADNLVLTGNYVNITSLLAIYAIGPLALIVTNNHFLGNDQNFDCIYLAELNRAIITGNYIYNFNKSGIYLSNSAPGVDRSIFANNVCNSNGRYGIEIAGANCAYNILLGNVLSNNTLGGYLNNGSFTEIGHNVSG